MPHIYIIIITALFFAFCTAALVYQAVYSVYFRKNIAIPHNFSEGILTGLTYPMLWVMYGLLAVQFLSFIVFRSTNEIVLALRLMLFAVNVIAFAAFKVLSPPLLAYWFGKTSFWDNKGATGKISFSDIYCVKVHSMNSNRIINNQQLYKISFYVKNKTFMFIPKRYVCRMTANQINILSSYVDFTECKKPRPTAKGLLYSIGAPILLFLIITCCFMQTVPTGILNSEKYSSVFASDKLSEPKTKEIETVSKITDVVTNGELLYVFYGDIGAVNTYDTNGSFKFALSLPHSVFKSGDIAFSDGKLIYKYGDKIIKYAPDGSFDSTESYNASAHKSLFKNESTQIMGNKITYGDDGVRLGDSQIVTRSAYFALFSPELVWSVNLILIVALFVLRQYVLHSDK